MPDIVVTVPIGFTHPCAPGKRGLDAWIGEGDPAGAGWSGVHWAFSLYAARPDIEPGERVYVVCEDRLRGYAPLVELQFEPVRAGKGHIKLIRGGGAVAVTIPQKILGFRGLRYRWWERSAEVPFPDWQTADRRVARCPQDASSQMEMF